MSFWIGKSKRMTIEKKNLNALAYDFKYLNDFLKLHRTGSVIY